jgi:hypothetical protein
MSATFFFYGFFSALVLVLILISALYVYLKRTRENKNNVKGYLDLIPDLTQLQRAQVKEIRRVFLPRVEGIRKNMRSKRLELAKLLFDEPAEREKIYAISAEIIAHQSELEHEVIEHILEERELLTPAQKRKFCEIILEQFSTGGLGVHDVKVGRKPDACAKGQRVRN